LTYTLYGCRRSGSLAVELALAEIGASYEVRDVDLETDAHSQGGDTHRIGSRKARGSTYMEPSQT